MKRIAIVLMTVLMLSFETICFGQTIDDKNLGISFNLSDDWINISDEYGMKFQNKMSADEGIMITTVDADWAYSMELRNENTLLELCEDIYSDYNLGKNLSQTNNAIVTVNTDSVLSKYEYYNNVLYFRYEKAYTATAWHYKPTSFYETIFVTAKNGKVYFISYQRNLQENHFSNVVDMLGNISFANGEIKIKINNEQIFADNTPMLINDRTLVPIRAVAEKMGYTVSWNDEKQIVTLSSNDGFNILHFQIGNDTAFKNLSEEITLDVPPVILENRTYLPLRAVAEAMNAKVNWNEAEKTVEITN